MILGRVSDSREAIVQLALKGNANQLRSVQSVVDTGYTGYLMLPQSIITELAWQCIGTQKGVLGDGSVKRFDVYLGMIIWDGEIQEVSVNASESEALIGMSLLDGYKIEIEAYHSCKINFQFHLSKQRIFHQLHLLYLFPML